MAEKFSVFIQWFSNGEPQKVQSGMSEKMAEMRLEALRGRWKSAHAIWIEKDEK